MSTDAATQLMTEAAKFHGITYAQLRHRITSGGESLMQPYYESKSWKDLYKVAEQCE